MEFKYYKENLDRPGNVCVTMSKSDFSAEVDCYFDDTNNQGGFIYFTNIFYKGRNVNNADIDLRNIDVKNETGFKLYLEASLDTIVEKFRNNGEEILREDSEFVDLKFDGDSVMSREEMISKLKDIIEKPMISDAATIRLIAEQLDIKYLTEQIVKEEEVGYFIKRELEESGWISAKKYTEQITDVNSKWFNTDGYGHLINFTPESVKSLADDLIDEVGALQEHQDKMSLF